MDWTRLTVVGAFIVAVNGGAVRGHDQDPSAAFVRLAPERFRELSLEIRQYLDQRNCTIPQSWFNKRPHNVVRGRFTEATNTDIAILCSTGEVSRLLVFRSGSATQVAELAHTNRTMAIFSAWTAARWGSRALWASRRQGTSKSTTRRMAAPSLRLSTTTESTTYS